MSPATIVEHVDGIVTPEDLPVGALHVVVFGPGHGEAVLLRMPDGRVGVVDGCGEPAAASDRGSPLFSLIEELGERRLLFACVTHPHQDHFGGFARLIQRHPPEHLWWSGTRERKFFEHYLKWLEKRGRDAPTGDTEPPAMGLNRLVQAINEAADTPDPDRRPRVQHLEDNKRLLRHPLKGGEVIIEGILPSSHGARAAEKDALQVLTEGKLDDAKRLFDPNRISGALLVGWGETRVLLGGDALCESDPHAGWDGLPEQIGKVHLVKVPHHASQGAHSERLWAEMKPDLAVVTCVKSATNDQPPRPPMLEKLLRSGCDLAVTSQPAWWTTEKHALAELPQRQPSSRPEASKSAGNPALAGMAKPRSAANKHENAVVARLDDRGNIVCIRLHGAARRLQIQTAAPAASAGVSPRSV